MERFRLATKNIRRKNGEEAISGANKVDDTKAISKPSETNENNQAAEDEESASRKKDETGDAEASKAKKEERIPSLKMTQIQGKSLMRKVKVRQKRTKNNHRRMLRIAQRITTFSSMISMSKLLKTNTRTGPEVAGRKKKERERETPGGKVIRV